MYQSHLVLHAAAAPTKGDELAEDIRRELEMTEILDDYDVGFFLKL